MPAAGGISVFKMWNPSDVTVTYTWNEGQNRYNGSDGSYLEMTYYTMTPWKYHNSGNTVEWDIQTDYAANNYIASYHPFTAEGLAQGWASHGWERDPTNIVATVTAGGDDGYTDGTTLNKTSTEGYIGYQNHHIYNRFLNVQIPKDATIVSAFFTHNAGSGGLDSPGTLAAIAADNVAQPTTVAHVATATKTTAQVSWARPYSGTEGYYTSPDIKTIIQEMVNRPGWVSGNALMLDFFTSFADGMNTVYQRMYEHGDRKTATLVVNFTAGVAAPAFVTKVVMI